MIKKVELGHGKICFDIIDAELIIYALPEAVKIGGLPQPKEDCEEIVRISCVNEESFLIFCKAVDKWKMEFLGKNSRGKACAG